MSDSNQGLIKKVMIENETGDTLIKTGVPDNYIVGDKSGQGLTYAIRNDLAFIYPDKHKKPIIILVIYTKQGDINYKQNDKVIDQATEKAIDRKSTRLNSSHVSISYAVFCLKKKKKKNDNE